MAFDASTAHFWLGDEDLGSFDFAKQPVQEARLFKRETGISPWQMMQGVEQMDPDALAALVWLLWRRKGKSIPYASVDFAVGDFTVKDADGNTPSVEDVEAAQAGPTSPAPAGNAITPAGISNGDASNTSPLSGISST